LDVAGWTDCGSAGSAGSDASSGSDYCCDLQTLAQRLLKWGKH